MSIENWIQLFSIIAAIITAALSYVMTERSKRVANERTLKEKFYLDYISAANNATDAINNSELIDKENAFRQLAKAYNQLLLIGSTDVVKNLIAFHDYLYSVTDSNFEFQEHNRLFTNLLKSIRIDLYKKQHVNKNYPQVHLLVANKRRAGK